MNPQLKKAIEEFIANEFHLQGDTLDPDIDFYTDLHLTENQLSDLLQRLQDSLSIVIPEDKYQEINTISDLLNALNPEYEAD